MNPMAPPNLSFAAFADITAQLSRIAKNLAFLSALQTPSAELRVSINSGTLPTVTTVTTVSSVTSVVALQNSVSLGGFRLEQGVMDDMNNYAANAIRRNITR